MTLTTNIIHITIFSVDANAIAIGMLIDRNDQIINIIEIKFYTEEFVISKEYTKKLRQKLQVFNATTKTRKQLFLTLITTFGLKQNQHSLGLIHQTLTLDDFFVI